MSDERDDLDNWRHERKRPSPYKFYLPVVLETRKNTYSYKKKFSYNKRKLSKKKRRIIETIPCFFLRRWKTMTTMVLLLSLNILSKGPTRRNEISDWPRVYVRLCEWLNKSFINDSSIIQYRNTIHDPSPLFPL